MELTSGVYETLISEAIKEKLKKISEDGFYIATEKIDSADSNSFFANYLAEIVSRILKDIKCTNKDETITEQIKRINEIFLFIQEKWKIDLSEDRLAIEQNFLRGIYNTLGVTKAQIEKKASIHPFSGYRVSNLFTGSNRDLSIDEEMRRDILTADNIDLMVSFILFTGLRLIIDELKEFVKKGGRLRIITTTYMGNSDPKALKRLLELKEYGNVEIKVSYTSSQERLHAKAYIFNRLNGLNTAFIGSSNLSKSAFTKGLEWNLRVTSIENKHIIEKAQASFDSYWNNENFESVENDDDLNKFEKAIFQERHKQFNTDDCSSNILVRFERKTHQIKVLEKLQYERNVLNSFRNLIIAATGTGKTAISAFDFKDFNKTYRKQHQRNARLLFVVHREQILKQARSTFRSVMADGNFGEIWTGNIQPSDTGSLEHLFVTVQTFASRIDTFKRLGPKFYNYIVIDEVHHAAADTYRKVFDVFTPEILIGLTATPERMDGQSIKPDFNNRFAAEIRLYDALNQQLLCPFQYFCITDESVNLSNVVFRGGKYGTSDLSNVLINDARIEVIDNALNRYLTNPHEVKAVCFCVTIKHANYMAEMLNKKYKAAAMTSENKSMHSNIISQFSRGDINYLCVVDIMNEGYDIPEIDTILFLRPTESLTIFLQQLGRGLRTADGKTELTVLDFIAQANKQYDYESRFRALTGGSRKTTEEGIKNGFSFLPRGCSIEMEKVAREYILETVRNSIFNLKRLRKDIQSFEDSTGQSLTISNFLEYYDLDPYALYNKSDKCWNALKRSAGILKDNPSELQLEVEKYLYQFIHINDIDFIHSIKQIVASDFNFEIIKKQPRHYIMMLYYDLYYKTLEKLNSDQQTSFQTMEEAIHALHNMQSLQQELIEILEFIEHHNINRVMKPLCNELDFKLYGLYSRDEINIIADGNIARGAYMSGKYDIKSHKIQMLFCTINKSDKEYSAETMYEDYAINSYTFHWQTQNNTKADSETGKLYTEQAQNGWRFLLFVRDTKTNNYNFTNPYYCLGFVDFINAKGECPMTINWKMREPIPASIYEIAAAI